MSLDKKIENAERCVRCSLCKWIPTPRILNWRFAGGCPSIQYGNFHAYSGGGKNITALALSKGRVDYTDEMLKSVHACSMCGACEISCNMNNGGNVEPYETMRELRVKIVEDGQANPAHMFVLDSLKRDDNTLGLPKEDRSKWTDGLKVKDILKEKAEVFLHVGCQLSYDQELWPVIRGAAAILEAAGVDFGIAKKEESCCGGRAFDMGYEGEFENYAESMIGRVKESGAKTLITCCSDGYGTFKQLYPLRGKEFKDIQVLHITEYIDRLLKEGKLVLNQNVPLRVTYHDPCHLGRLGEAYTPWKGEYKKVLNKMRVSEPEKQVRFGVNGIYDPPRDILKAIPGVELVEMERIREYSYCCGAGGGAMEAYPDFTSQAATERLEEAKYTGAEAMVTSCPWCERNFKDTAEEIGGRIKIFDIIELVLKAMGE